MSETQIFYTVEQLKCWQRPFLKEHHGPRVVAGRKEGAQRAGRVPFKPFSIRNSS